MGVFDFLKKKPTIKSGEQRKAQTHKKLQAMGITINPHLPLLETAEEVAVKSKDEICRRAITAICMIQIACDVLDNNNPLESAEFFGGVLYKFGIEPCMDSTEARVLFSDLRSEENLLAITWTYEAYWSLAWALGLVEDITNASSCCDCATAVQFVSECNTFAQFTDKCKMRPTEEILDMLDLYYRYHWACVNKTLDEGTCIGNLNPEVVMERRRGLEWLISEEDDWFEISLDT